MKTSIQRFACLCAAITLITASCNSGDGDKKAADTTAAAAMPAAPAPLKEELFIQHKVANFAKWKPLFDADASNRAAAGLTDHIVARGAEDSNMVLVITYMEDAAKARAFAGDPKLKEVMGKAGVTGAPKVSFIHRVYSDTTKTDVKQRVLLHLTVKDFDAWKKAFDAGRTDREAAGLTDRMVGYSVDDNHQVTVVCVVNDMSKAKTFGNSKELAEKMKAAGVEGKPERTFFTIVEKKN